MRKWDLRGLRVLDIGCGLGLAGVMGGLQGAASITMSDRSERAVQLALEACRANGVQCEVRGVVSDWSGDAEAQFGQMDLLLGNEVIYVRPACG
jgi:16S rRNA G1207 methylase RsmC